MDIYTFNQFKGLNEGNYKAWMSFDETHQEDREQIIIKTTLDNINYQNIIRKSIYRSENWKNAGITSRVYFIHPTKHMYFLYFDSCVCLGSKDVTSLIRHYHKYYQHISKKIKRNSNNIFYKSENYKYGYILKSEPKMSQNKELKTTIY